IDFADDIDDLNVLRLLLEARGGGELRDAPPELGRAGSAGTRQRVVAVDDADAIDLVAMGVGPRTARANALRGCITSGHCCLGAFSSCSPRGAGPASAAKARSISLSSASSPDAPGRGVASFAHGANGAAS